MGFHVDFPCHFTFCHQFMTHQNDQPLSAFSLGSQGRLGDMSMFRQVDLPSFFFFFFFLSHSLCLFPSAKNWDVGEKLQSNVSQSHQTLRSKVSSSLQVSLEMTANIIQEQKEKTRIVVAQQAGGSSQGSDRTSSPNW